MVTGRKSKKNDDDPSSIGAFHELRSELQDSLIITCKRHADTTRKDFARKLCEQRAARAEKAKLLRDKQLKNAEHDLIEAMCLYEQYHSPACWMTTSAAFREYNKLTTKKDRLKKVKEQILM